MSRIIRTSALALAVASLATMLACAMARRNSDETVTAELVVEKPTTVVDDRELTPGRYEVQLDTKRGRIEVRGPVSFASRALMRSSAQPEPKVRAALRYYSPRNALLLVFVSPQQEWVATAREAPL
jgi:hypothetical protein